MITFINLIDHRLYWFENLCKSIYIILYIHAYAYAYTSELLRNYYWNDTDMLKMFFTIILQYSKYYDIL